MKTLYQILLITASVLFFKFSFAQTTPPLLINYQAVAHDNSGNTLSNQSVDLIIKILDGSGATVWSEEHNSINTNDYGLISLLIGNGTNQTASFSSINWSAGTYSLKIEIMNL